MKIKRLKEVKPTGTNLVYLQEVIGGLEDNEPDKRTKGWKEWKEKINRLMRDYNQIAKGYHLGQIYVLIK